MYQALPHLSGESLGKRLEHPYVAKLEKPLDIGELTLRAEKTACYRSQQQTTKVHILAIVRQSILQNYTKCTQ